jgi:hypothetical protein
VGPLWTRDRPVTKTSTRQHTDLQEENIHVLVGFEPAIPGNERPQNYSLDGAATGIVIIVIIIIIIIIIIVTIQVQLMTDIFSRTWQWFSLEKGNRNLFVTSNRCIPVKNTLG